MYDWKKEDWIPIIEYIKDVYDGVLLIRIDEYFYKFKIQSYEDIEKAKNALKNLLWDALDGGQCPFILYNKDEDIWFCEVHDIRPIVCKEYRCDGEYDNIDIEEYFGEGYISDYENQTFNFISFCKQIINQIESQD